MVRSFSTAVVAYCFIVLLASCAVVPSTPTATTNYDHNYDFSNIHKIAIQPTPKDTLETMLISDQQISRVDAALKSELERRGFEVVTRNADADMFLSWRFVPQESDDVATFDPGSESVSQGTLYVNMIDPIILQSVWRSTFHSDLRDQPETSAAAAYRREVAVAVLADFPPVASAQ